MVYTKGANNFIENHVQFEEDRLIDSDLMDRMIQETFEYAYEEISEEQETASATVEILIGSAHIPAGQIQKYREGDLIPLDQKLSDPVSIILADGEIFKGRLGKVKENYAIRLTKS